MASLNKTKINNRIIDTMVSWMTETQQNQQNYNQKKKKRRTNNLIDKWTQKKIFKPCLFVKIIKEMHFYKHLSNRDMNRVNRK